VQLAATGTRWLAGDDRQTDRWVTAGRNPAAALGRYADATGRRQAKPDGLTLGNWIGTLVLHQLIEGRGSSLMRANLNTSARRSRTTIPA
jgi:hypothetical protein